MTWPFGDMRPLSYQMLVVDPPWAFDNYSAAGEAKNAKAQYSCMGIDEIKQLPVGALAGGDCCMWLWATNPMLPQALEVMSAWGFTFKTAGHWVKRTVKGKLAFGTGYILRCAGEPFIIGTVGEPQFARNVRSVLEGPIREHSRKPDEAYVAAEALVPNALKRGDIFSRERRPLRDSFGLEANKFAGVAA